MSFHQVENSSPGDYFYDVGGQLKQLVYRRSMEAFAAGDAARDALTTREAVLERGREVRRFFLESIGGLPETEHGGPKSEVRSPESGPSTINPQPSTPLDARTVGVIEEDGLRIERVIFQSRPGHYVTANLYLPEGHSGPGGAVQFLCGHHQQAKHQDEYQIVCRHLAAAGLVVLAQDPIGQGERFSYHEPDLGDSTITWGTQEHDYAGAQCLPLGDCLARYFLHDAMRGIDYLQSRPEVDPERIGVTGNSGGGTQTSLMMLADPRIAAAAPATFIMNRETMLWSGHAQDAEQIWPGFTAAGYDHEDILLAMAPKPVRVLAVTSDFFPIEGTRRTVQRCKRQWALFGREDALDLVEDESTHAFTPRLARAAAEFFSQHLLGVLPLSQEQERGKAGEGLQPIEPRRLWCTQSGQVRGELPGAAFVFEANQERLAQIESARHSQPGRSEPSTFNLQPSTTTWLRQRVLSGRRPCDLNPRFYHGGHVEEMALQRALWWSQEGLFGHGYVVRPIGREDRLPVTLAVWDGGTARLSAHSDWIRQTCAGARAVLVLDVAGVGGLAPQPITRTDSEAFYGVIHKLATDLIWLGDDLVSLRTYDVLRALEMAERWPGLVSSGLRLYAHGRHGLYGVLAAALDPRIEEVEVVDGIGSWAEWIRSRHYDNRDIYSIILPGALRHFDLPELVGRRNRSNSAEE